MSLVDLMGQSDSIGNSHYELGVRRNELSKVA